MILSNYYNYLIDFHYSGFRLLLWFGKNECGAKNPWVEKNSSNIKRLTVVDFKASTFSHSSKVLSFDWLCRANETCVNSVGQCFFFSISANLICRWNENVNLYWCFHRQFSVFSLYEPFILKSTKFIEIKNWIYQIYVLCPMTKSYLKLHPLLLFTVTFFYILNLSLKSPDDNNHFKFVKCSLLSPSKKVKLCFYLNNRKRKHIILRITTTIKVIDLEWSQG